MVRRESLAGFEQTLFDYIVKSIEDRGYPPSIREMVVGTERAAATVCKYLNRLEEKGYIRRSGVRNAGHLQVVGVRWRMVKEMPDEDQRVLFPPLPELPSPPQDFVLKRGQEPEEMIQERPPPPPPREAEGIPEDGLVWCGSCREPHIIGGCQKALADPDDVQPFGPGVPLPEPPHTIELTRVETVSRDPTTLEVPVVDSSAPEPTRRGRKEDTISWKKRRCLYCGEYAPEAPSETCPDNPKICPPVGALGRLSVDSHGHHWAWPGDISADDLEKLDTRRLVHIAARGGKAEPWVDTVSREPAKKFIHPDIYVKEKAK